MPSIPGTLNFPTSYNDSISLFEVANRANSNLNGAINNSVTSLTLVDASLFPNSGAISIDSEICYYTGKSTNTLTGLVRGCDGTSAASHANGAVVKMNPVSAHHEVLRDAILALETKLGIGANTPALGTFLTSRANGSGIWGRAIGASDTANEPSWGTTGSATKVLQGADSTADSSTPYNPISSLTAGIPSMVFQSERSGGVQGNPTVVYGFRYRSTGLNDMYGISLFGRFNANLNGVSGLINQTGLRSYVIGVPTNFGSATVCVYGAWLQGERSVSGIRAVGAQIDSNNNGSDANVATSNNDTTFNIATNYTSLGHATGIIYSQGAKETSAYAGWYVDNNAICQRVLDFTAATATLQGTWSTNGTTTVSGSGGHANVECVAGDILIINGVLATVASATANSITLTAAFSGGTLSNQTITKKVQPMWLANNSYLWWQNAAGNARYRALGLGADDSWLFDGDGRNITFGSTRFQGDLSTATHANRLMFRTSTSNSNSTLGITPNGTASVSGYNAYNSPDPDNASFAGLQITSASMNLISSKLGSGSFLPINIVTNGSTMGQFTTSGALLLGTTTDDASAILNLTSTSKGVLFPRMTTTQRDAISSPTNGLVLYNSTTNKLQVRAAGAWVDLH